jgi:4-hydroxy-tetrahydrodipicolinate reductase
MKIAMCGYDGKMGSKIYEFLRKKESLFEFVLINQSTNDVFTKIKNVDVVVDFTNRDFTYNLALFCAKNKIPFVSGTTALTNNELDKINQEFIYNSTGAYIIPNFSKGINIIKKTIPLLKIYDDIYIEETHNISKLDSPSGTSIQLKENFNKDIKIFSKRKKHYKAIHKIVCQDSYEEFIIIHKVINKFAYGDFVLKAINTVNSFIGLKKELI